MNGNESRLSLGAWTLVLALVIATLPGSSSGAEKVSPCKAVAESLLKREGITVALPINSASAEKLGLDSVRNGSDSVFPEMIRKNNSMKVYFGLKDGQVRTMRVIKSFHSGPNSPIVLKKRIEFEQEGDHCGVARVDETAQSLKYAGHPRLLKQSELDEKKCSSPKAPTQCGQYSKLFFKRDKKAPAGAWLRNGDGVIVPQDSAH